LDVLVEKRKVLDDKSATIDAEAPDKLKNSKWDCEDASMLRDSALKSLSIVSEEEDAMLAEAALVLEIAEAALVSQGCAAALKCLQDGTVALERISLRPDRRASPSSLTGRLHTILNTPREFQGHGCGCAEI
jgi:hypothetical protein